MSEDSLNKCRSFIKRDRSYRKYTNGGHTDEKMYRTKENLTDIEQNVFWHERKRQPKNQFYTDTNSSSSDSSTEIKRYSKRMNHKDSDRKQRICKHKRNKPCLEQQQYNEYINTDREKNRGKKRGDVYLPIYSDDIGSDEKARICEIIATSTGKHIKLNAFGITDKPHQKNCEYRNSDGPDNIRTHRKNRGSIENDTLNNSFILPATQRVENIKDCRKDSEYEMGRDNLSINQTLKHKNDFIMEKRLRLKPCKQCKTPETSEYKKKDKKLVENSHEMRLRYNNCESVRLHDLPSNERMNDMHAFGRKYHESRQQVFDEERQSPKSYVSTMLYNSAAEQRFGKSQRQDHDLDTVSRYEKREKENSEEMRVHKKIPSCAKYNKDIRERKRSYCTGLNETIDVSQGHRKGSCEQEVVTPYGEHRKDITYCQSSNDALLSKDRKKHSKRKRSKEYINEDRLCRHRVRRNCPSNYKFSNECKPLPQNICIPSDSNDFYFDHKIHQTGSPKKKTKVSRTPHDYDWHYEIKECGNYVNSDDFSPEDDIKDVQLQRRNGNLIQYEQRHHSKLEPKMYESASYEKLVLKNMAEKARKLRELDRETKSKNRSRKWQEICLNTLSNKSPSGTLLYTTARKRNVVGHSDDTVHMHDNFDGGVVTIRPEEKMDRKTFIQKNEENEMHIAKSNQDRSHDLCINEDFNYQARISNLCEKRETHTNSREQIQTDTGVSATSRTTEKKAIEYCNGEIAQLTIGNALIRPNEIRELDDNINHKKDTSTCAKYSCALGDGTTKRYLCRKRSNANSEGMHEFICVDIDGETEMSLESTSLVGKSPKCICVKSYESDTKDTKPILIMLQMIKGNGNMGNEKTEAHEASDINSKILGQSDENRKD